MVFLSLPLRVGSIDAAAHMAEEIVSPERNIPRAMFASAITHFFLVYLTVIMYSLGVGTFSMGRYAVSPFVSR
jgi:amino acid transporter